MNSIQLKDAVYSDSTLHSFFKGIFPINEVPTVLTSPSCMIINLDPSYLPGSHWVVICKNSEGRGYYIDSFGRLPPPLLKMERYDDSWGFNNQVLQASDSVLCGEYCLYILYWWVRGRDINMILSDFKSPKENELMVDLFCKSIFPIRDFNFI